MINMFRVICFLVVVVSASVICAQEISLNFKNVGWDDGDFSVEYRVNVPVTEMVEQEYEVPYVENVRENGKQIPKQKMRTKMMKRQIPVTRIREETHVQRIPLEIVNVSTLDGNVLSDSETLKAKFAKPQLVLFLEDIEELTDLHKQVLKEGMLVVAIKQSKSPDNKN